MAHHPALRAKAIELRVVEALTIDELAERLALSRSTVYHWVRGVPIPRTSRASEGQRKGTRGMQRACRRRREAAYAQGRAEYRQLSQDPTFRDFVCMYIGEGYKRSRNAVSLCNSDPAVVALADRWIRRYAENPVSYVVQYHADQEPRKLAAFWSETLGVAQSEIRLQRKTNSGQLAGRKWRCAHGVMAVSSWDTLLRARLQAWIDCVKAEWV